MVGPTRFAFYCSHVVAMTHSSDAQRCATYMKALGDPLRLRMVECLRTGELTVSDIAALMEIEIANASHHLRLLYLAGLATTRREGKYIYYSLDPTVFNRGPKSTSDTLDFGCCRVELNTLTTDGNAKKP